MFLTLLLDRSEEPSKSSLLVLLSVKCEENSRCLNHDEFY